MTSSRTSNTCPARPPRPPASPAISRRATRFPCDSCMSIASEKFRSQLSGLAALPEQGRIEDLIEAAKKAGITEEALCRVQADAFALPFAASLSDYPTSSEFVAAIPIAFARRYKMLGLAPRDAGVGRITIAISDVSNWEQLQVVSRLLGRPVGAIVAPPSIVLAAINEAYQQRTGQAQEFIETL